MDIVVGAGIVGVSVALGLQRYGRQVMLIERGEPGKATSFGNAGLIETSDLVPRGFPRAAGEIARYATGHDPRARLDWRVLPRLGPFLFGYWRNSAPKRLTRIGHEIAPFFLASLAAHKRQMDEAGALHLLRDEGWLHLYRTQQVPRDTQEAAALARTYGHRAEIIDGQEVARREPALVGKVTSAVHWRDAATLSDPYEYTRLLVELFVKRGGTLVRGTAERLSPGARAGWTVQLADKKTLTGETLVLAPGPWAPDLVRPLGYKLPLQVKRGYHMHYAIADSDRPELPVIDVEKGYVLSPMRPGVRLTTGIEFAARDSRPTPRQLDKVEPFARQLLRLGGRVDAAPWMGSRPVTADMKPVIGAAPRHKGLFFAFGHAHHGLTLAAITGEALSAEIAGETPAVDLVPFSPARFG